MDTCVTVPFFMLSICCARLRQSQKGKRDKSKCIRYQAACHWCLFTLDIRHFIGLSVLYLVFHTKCIAILWHEICLFRHENKQICAPFHFIILFNSKKRANARIQHCTLYGNRNFFVWFCARLQFIRFALLNCGQYYKCDMNRSTLIVKSRWITM